MKNLLNFMGIKTKIITFVLLAFIFPSGIFSQTEAVSPKHPLVNYGPTRIDINIDTVLTFTYYEMGSEVPFGPRPGLSIYTRSEDKLTDTVATFSGLIRHDIYRYNEKNQLLYQCVYYPNHPLTYYVREDYQYNEEGQVIKIVAKEIRPGETPSEVFLNEYTYDYSTVQLTDKGYIFDGRQFDLDQDGRLVYSYYAKGHEEYKEEYIEYVDGKKYRIGADYYTYTDSSYTASGYYQPGNMVLGMTDMWIEVTHVFYENGNYKGKRSRVSVDGVNWKPLNIVEHEYIYANVINSDIPSENSPVIKTNTEVYTFSGEIHILTGNNVMVQIYDLSGRLVKKQTVSAGENQISLSSGFYLVKVGNETFKVYVR